MYQIGCGFVYTETAAERFSENPKLDRTLELVDEALANNRVIVIWTSFTEELNIISESLTKMGIHHGLLYGDMKIAERDCVVSKFCDGSLKVVIGNVALGIGIDLVQKDITVIRCSNPTNGDQFLQSEKRTHRIGVEGTVFYYDLLASDLEKILLDHLNNIKSTVQEFLVATTYKNRFTADLKKFFLDRDTI